MNVSQESGIKVIDNEEKTDVLKSLDNLVEETLQIYEYNEEEEITIEEIFQTITMMLTQMKATVPINVALVGPPGTVENAILGQDGKIMLRYNDEEVHYKTVIDYPPSVLLAIMADIFPKLKDVAANYRKNLEQRLTLYRTANKKMRKIAKALTMERKIGLEDIAEEEEERDDDRNEV